MSDSFSWGDLRDWNRKTLETLYARRLLRDQPAETYATIVDDWLFPLYDLSLGSEEVDPAVLRTRQQNSTP